MRNLHYIVIQRKMWLFFCWNGPLCSFSGLVPPRIAQELMGWSGEVLIVILILLAVTTTGSAEVMAITSILVYDCYQIHLKPFRRVADSNGCILCGKSRGRMASLRDQCGCQSMTDCKWCHADDRWVLDCQGAWRTTWHSVLMQNETVQCYV